ncbi:hypothetical protein HYH03_018576 [Edaphochlamys debaryana]|uniref:Uncharacterized protein n=1 Tax=Edaphochlamys debaryana TaxID=47281 RepID=A0A836BMT6_9CHLO|nr:hypothetical protein HYH03_018576 [Edaphochlamys debaryana]|eukprot:KAG2482501.1 hypothetical protein HYH03_018576 [Edaphochlamys debaryana]
MSSGLHQLLTASRRVLLVQKITDELEGKVGTVGRAELQDAVERLERDVFALSESAEQYFSAMGARSTQLKEDLLASGAAAAAASQRGPPGAGRAQPSQQRAAPSGRATGARRRRGPSDDSAPGGREAAGTRDAAYPSKGRAAPESQPRPSKRNETPCTSESGAGSTTGGACGLPAAIGLADAFGDATSLLRHTDGFGGLGSGSLALTAGPGQQPFLSDQLLTLQLPRGTGMQSRTAYVLAQRLAPTDGTANHTGPGGEHRPNSIDSLFPYFPYTASAAGAALAGEPGGYWAPSGTAAAASGAAGTSVPGAVGAAAAAEPAGSGPNSAPLPRLVSEDVMLAPPDLQAGSFTLPTTPHLMLGGGGPTPVHSLLAGACAGADPFLSGASLGGNQYDAHMLPGAAGQPAAFPAFMSDRHVHQRAFLRTVSSPAAAAAQWQLGQSAAGLHPTAPGSLPDLSGYGRTSQPDSMGSGPGGTPRSPPGETSLAGGLGEVMPPSLDALMDDAFGGGARAGGPSAGPGPSLHGFQGAGGMRPVAPAPPPGPPPMAARPASFRLLSMQPGLPSINERAADSRSASGGQDMMDADALCGGGGGPGVAHPGGAGGGGAGGADEPLIPLDRLRSAANPMSLLHEAWPELISPLEDTPQPRGVRGRAFELAPAGNDGGRGEAARSPPLPPPAPVLPPVPAPAAASVLSLDEQALMLAQHQQQLQAQHQHVSLQLQQIQEQQVRLRQQQAQQHHHQQQQQLQQQQQQQQQQLQQLQHQHQQQRQQLQLAQEQQQQAWAPQDGWRAAGPTDSGAEPFQLSAGASPALARSRTLGAAPEQAAPGPQSAAFVSAGGGPASTQQQPQQPSRSFLRNFTLPTRLQLPSDGKDDTQARSFAPAAVPLHSPSQPLMAGGAMQPPVDPSSLRGSWAAGEGAGLSGLLNATVAASTAVLGGNVRGSWSAGDQVRAGSGPGPGPGSFGQHGVAGMQGLPYGSSFAGAAGIAAAAAAASALGQPTGHGRPLQQPSASQSPLQGQGSGRTSGYGSHELPPHSRSAVLQAHRKAALHAMRPPPLSLASGSIASTPDPSPSQYGASGPLPSPYGSVAGGSSGLGLQGLTLGHGSCPSSGVPTPSSHTQPPPGPGMGGPGAGGGPLGRWPSVGLGMGGGMGGGAGAGAGLMSPPGRSGGAGGSPLEAAQAQAQAQPRPSPAPPTPNFSQPAMAQQQQPQFAPLQPHEFHAPSAEERRHQQRDGTLAAATGGEGAPSTGSGSSGPPISLRHGLGGGGGGSSGERGGSSSGTGASGDHAGDEGGGGGRGGSGYLPQLMVVGEADPGAIQDSEMMEQDLLAEFQITPSSAMPPLAGDPDFPLPLPRQR